MKRPLFQPDEDRVLVLPDLAKEKTESGLYIVTSEQMISGIIVRIGPDSGKQEGDHVMYSKYAGTPVTIDGVDYKIMRKGDVFGILEDAGK